MLTHEQAIVAAKQLMSDKTKYAKLKKKIDADIEPLRAYMKEFPKTEMLGNVMPYEKAGRAKLVGEESDIDQLKKKLKVKYYSKTPNLPVIIDNIETDDALSELLIDLSIEIDQKPAWQFKYV